MYLIHNITILFLLNIFKLCFLNRKYIYYLYMYNKKRIHIKTMLVPIKDNNGTIFNQKEVLPIIKSDSKESIYNTQKQDTEIIPIIYKKTILPMIK